MEKAYKYRIYPNKKQKEIITKTFGCCRFVYNKYLAKRIEMYEQNKETFSYVQCANDMKKLKSELEWLKEVDSTALQSSLKDLDSAYQKFFKEHAGYPKFKSKKTHRFSYKSKCVNGNIQYCDKYIKLPKLGMVKTKNKLVPQGRILNATVSKEPSGKYFVSLCCTDVDIKPLEKTDNAVGIDLGIKEFCITSDGKMIPNSKYLKKSLDKLAKLQRELSRKSKDSSNRNKARIKVARLQEHIANQRKDFLQKLSTEIIKNNDVVCIEKKFKITGGTYIEVPNNYRASQYDHTADDYIKKKLSDRLYRLRDETLVQRDWYSSFLLYCYDYRTQNIDKDKCITDFGRCYDKEKALIAWIKANHIKILNSGIKVT